MTMDRKGAGEELDLGPTRPFGPPFALSFGRVAFKMRSPGGDRAGEGEPDYTRSLGPPRGGDGDSRRRELLPRRQGRPGPPLSIVDPFRHLAAEFDPDRRPADDGTGAVVDLPARGAAGASGRRTTDGLSDAARARSVRHQLQRS